MEIGARLVRSGEWRPLAGRAGFARRARGHRRRFLVALLGALGAAAVSCRGQGPAPAAGAGAPERVILVTIDTLRADHLGCYGNAGARTPVLDALAREGILYDSANSAAPITLVSHATIMTGLIPPAHGVRTNGSFRLPASVETLAERLKARGFATGAFVGAFVLHHEFGLDQGFDVYDDTLPRGSGTRRFDFAERRASDVLAKAEAWVAGRASDRFFLWVHLFDPHAPYDPPPPFAEAFAAHPYDGEIAYVDAELGKFFQTLKGAGLWERSLVLVMADHGEGLGEHGESTHGLFLYQSTVRVPLIVRPPGGLAAGARVEEPVGLVDVTPTVLSSLGIDPGPGLQGRVLPGLSYRGSAKVGGGNRAGRSAGSANAAGTDDSPRAEGADRAKAQTASEPSRAAGQAGTPGGASGNVAGYYCENLMPHFSFGWAGLVGYRAGSMKVIRSAQRELYDLANDPGETRDLAGGGGEAGRIGAELASRLDAAMETPSVAGAAAAENPGLSEEARQNLLALGYVAAGSRTGQSFTSGPDPRSMLPFFEGIEQAKDLLRSGESGRAIAVLDKLASQGPGSVGVLGLLGQAHMERGEIDAAMAALGRAAALDPHDYEIRRRLAEGFYAKGDYARAAEEAREALRLNDRNAESRSVLGAALGRLGRADEAIASFREAIAQRPEEAALQYNLGLTLERASRPGEAETAYRRAIEIDPGPDSVPSREALASLMLRRRDAAAARAQLEEAVRLDPHRASSWEQLGIVTAGSGDLTGALADFDRAIAADPERAEAYFDRGLVLERLGRPAEAAGAYRDFTSRWKGDPARLRAAEERLRRLGG